MTDWIEWKGGECPVPKDALVEVRDEIGRTMKDAAEWFLWRPPSRIVAHRVVQS